ncbi:agmatine/peptidylarginine deiminase [Photobacterium sp. OFAV2-7]|uniref:agmatine deiminase family protein n=1 Tax=Photobacterium sp. OFAV2-7 TaxID=2917748 RepID=UPI001EF4AF74|nr:agmatine deiminase family protein [Photobacterium sp. OFAV2-7]MCG7586337.1 agmatine deiminase family protein [Photobacterium sp. OFAV2-7]
MFSSPRKLLNIAILCAAAGLVACSADSTTPSTNSTANSTKTTNVRVPAEWEPQAAVWMQYPDQWEANMRPAFARIVSVIQKYQPVHMLTRTQEEKDQAQQLMTSLGVAETNLEWHVVPIDNAWMRDNGPIYVTDGTSTWIQNWGFNAWGGNFGGDVGYTKDNLIPDYVANQLNVKSEQYLDYILEKGNVEVNGEGILVINWDCQDNRNPGMTQQEHEAILKEKLGVHTIIWAFGHYPGEGTTGHIDGTARFVNNNTLVVTVLDDSRTDDLLVNDAEAAGLNVLRYDGNPNWLVGNGFVAAMADDQTQYNASLKTQLESFYPGRDVFLIETSDIANAGGGIHCVTNDQPVI